MGLGTRVAAWLAREAPEDLDPAEPVEVAIVPLPDGPLMVSALQATGIRAVGLEAPSRWGAGIRSWNRMRILVPRADEGAARTVLDDLREP